MYNTMDGMNGKYQRYHCAVGTEMIMMILGFDDLPKEAEKLLQEALAILDDTIGKGFSIHVNFDDNGESTFDTVENF